MLSGPIPRLASSWAGLTITGAAGEQIGTAWIVGRSRSHAIKTKRRRGHAGAGQQPLGAGLVAHQRQALGRRAGERVAQQLDQPGDLGFAAADAAEALEQIEHHVGVLQLAKRGEQFVDRSRRRPSGRTSCPGASRAAETASTDSSTPASAGIVGIVGRQCGSL